MQPIQPPIPPLWTILNMAHADLAAAPAGQPLKILRLCPANVFTGQAECNTFCANLDVKDNLVYANAWASEPAGSIAGRVTTTGCVWLSGYVAPNNQGTELNALQISLMSPSHWPPGFIPIPGVSLALRDQYHADQVTLYDNAQGVCGLGYMNASLYGKDYAESIVQKGCADSNFSDVHERGHNMGLEHDNPNATSDPASPDGYGFCDNVGAPVPHNRRDPMVYPSPCGGSRVAYFGNPNDTHFGYPFGNATHNAARIVRWAMPIMANFYPPLAPLPAAPGKPTVH
jgi:hypothetical protein